MGAKRALIVDDSKSARLFLARVLEKYEIDVDSADSAEAAITYLTDNRPDVIFMDHQMPGMDGLQAVQAIKNDPRTATIPIMMYTSQEGELYLGQARALGALGVLPKQIKQTDVSKVLYQLHLVPDRRSSDQLSFTPAHLHEAGAPDPWPPLLSKPLTDSALREHFAELRRALVAGIDTQTERITAEVRALLLEALPPPPPGSGQHPHTRPWWLLIACALLGLTLMNTALWWRSTRHEPPPEPARSAPAASAVALPPAASAAQPAPAGEASAAAAHSAASTDIKPLIVPVPYGAETLGGARLETIRALLTRLVRQKVAGVAEIRTFAGRFCLLGNANEGYSLAPDETPFSKCDLVGNPSEDAAPAAQRIPLSLANYIGYVRSESHGTLDAQILAGDPASVLAAYPPVAADLTAGEWNRAGSANNRLEIRVR
jgi:CheY-like chemotaxis protein